MTTQTLEFAQSANEEAINLCEHLSQLVASGRASHGLNGSESPISAQVHCISELAEESLAVAFVTWSHRMATEYLDRWGSDGLKERYLSELKAGTRIGSTALATALSDNSGARELPITFEEVDGGFLINGFVPWASNLRPGTLVFFGARELEGERRALFATEIGLEGVNVKSADQLLGLNGTSSGSIRFESHLVTLSQLLTFETGDFFKAMRPRFLLLQAAFCLGLARASLAASVAANSLSLGQIVQRLADRLAELSSKLDELAGQLDDYSPNGPLVGPEPFLRVRLELALLAQEATRVELATVGGRGYFVTHPTSRRVRESLFLSIQAPTEEALRWELQHFS
jgi:alkylation response protein AidB-like acyl-CoA dehydrogenase